MDSDLHYQVFGFEFSVGLVCIAKVKKVGCELGSTYGKTQVFLAWVSFCVVAQSDRWPSSPHERRRLTHRIGQQTYDILRFSASLLLVPSAL